MLLPELIALLGLANPKEVEHTKCNFALDLDDNNSTDQTNGFYYEVKCPNDSVSLSDYDASLHSKYKIDSMFIETMNPLPDQGYEKLYYDNNPKFNVSYLGDRLKVINSTGANTEDIFQFIKQIKYQNSKYSVTAGSRMFVITIFAGYKIESAMAELVLPSRSPAGKSDSVTLCKYRKDFELFLGLSEPKSSGGFWLEKTQGDSSWINTRIYNERIFHYVVISSSCYSDTASLKVKYYPEIKINLGPDTVFCEKTTLKLETGVFSLAEWQDGKMRINLTVDTLGLYWAKIRDANLCEYIDSIQVTINNELSHSAKDKYFCKNSGYNHHGHIITVDTLIVDTNYTVKPCPIIENISLKESKFNFLIPEIVELIAGQTFQISLPKYEKIDFLTGNNVQVIDDTILVFTPGTTQV